METINRVCGGGLYAAFVLGVGVVDTSSCSSLRKVTRVKIREGL